MNLNVPNNALFPLRNDVNRTMALHRSEKQGFDIIRKPGGRVSSSASEKSQNQKLRESAEAFESVFLFQMLKQVRSTIHKDGFLDGGLAEETFTGMLDEEYAKVMASSSSAGIADLLYQQLSRRIPASDAPAELNALPAPNDRSLVVQAQLRRVEQEIGAQNRAAAVSAISHIP